ncbi:MAG: hypothetical protein R3E01_31695 [Pirellulaceae bacterium]|nr:hypothetical protein [Planctomycetales bacterium]
MAIQPSDLLLNRRAWLNTIVRSGVVLVLATWTAWLAWRGRHAVCVRQAPCATCAIALGCARQRICPQPMSDTSVDVDVDRSVAQ